MPTFDTGVRSGVFRGLLLACLLMTACDRPVSEESWTISQRLIVEPTDQVLNLNRVKKSHGYENWSLGDADESRRWKSPDPSAPSAEGGFLRVPPTGRVGKYVRLSREVDLVADNVSALLVEARGIRQGRLRLFWAGPGEGYVAERGMHVEAGRGSATGTEVYRIELAGHPLWTGKIRGLRLDVPDVIGQVVELEAVSTVGGEGFESRLLASLLARDWKVSLGHEARNAVLNPPGVPLPWNLSAPAQGKLRFAYGLPQGTGPAMTFRVLGPTSQVLFEDTLVPNNDPRVGKWIEAEVELASAVDELVFETVVADDSQSYTLDHGIPAWGHPEILERSPGRQRPNVVLISIDTLRADRLGVYGYPQPTSPNIDRWARERGVVFRRAITTAPWTLPSHVSMLSGLDAISHGVNHRLPAPTELAMLPEILRREGFSTVGITGGGWLHPDNGLAQGFDVFRYWGQAQAAEQEVVVGVEHALQALSGARRPFFLFFHTYEVHDPYRHRLPYASRCPAPADGGGKMLYGAREKTRQADTGFAVDYKLLKWLPGELEDAVAATEDELPLVNCLYDSGVSYADAQVGRLLDRLGELELDRETLVVLTSDHGESLGEQGHVKHAYLDDNNLLVPLIMALPDRQHAGTVVDAQVSTVDIVPTILAVLGLEAEGLGRPIDGGSLVPLLSADEPEGSREAWSYAGSTNYGVSLRVNDRLQYIFNNTAWQPLVARDELFDLRSDSEPRPNIAAESSRQVDGFRSRLVSHLQERGQGVRVEFDHRGCGEVAGVVTGLPIHLSRIKSEQLPQDAFVWLGQRRASFRVGPSQAFSVLLEAARGPLTLSGTVSSCDGEAPTPFRATVDLDELEDRWRLAYDGSDWVEGFAGVESESDSVAQIQLRRVGSRAPAEAAGEIDPALVEQLKALGYINN